MAILSVGEIFILIGTALLIPAVFFGLHIAIKKLSFWNRLRRIYQQLIISAVLISLVIFIYWFGIDFKPIPAPTTSQEPIEIIGCYGGATSIPVLASLVFGWPAGLITGALAALFRGLLYNLHHVDYLFYAECASVLFSGIIGAILIKFLFADKKPKWGYGIIIAILIETVHMIMIFITGMFQRDISFAYAVIRQCDIPCVLVVAFAIIATLLSITIYDKESVRFDIKSKTLSAKIQKWMLVSFSGAVIIASFLIYFIVSTQSSVELHNTLQNAARDVVYELETAYWGENSTKWTKSEMKGICYTRRVRNWGYVVITGVAGNDEHGDAYTFANEGLNPGETIEQDKIYSTALLLESTYYDQIATGFKNKDGSKQTLNYSSNLSLKISEILSEQTGQTVDEKWNNHPMTPMFEAYVEDKENDNKLISVNAVVVRARILDEDNKSVVQEFDVISILTRDEALENMGMSLRMAIYIELLIFTTIYAVIYAFIRRSVVVNVQKINNSLEKITDGDLSVEVNVRSNADFASLSDDINETVTTLKGYISDAKKRVEKELAFAKAIQQGTLPYIFPSTSAYDLFASMRAAKEVGGDFYDFFPLTNNRLFFLIADVSGKGIPAAMFMMRSETLIKSLVQTDEMELDQIIAAVNEELCSNNEAQMFLTCWCGILDINTGHLVFVNAGHNRPIIKRKNGSFEELKISKNFVLAGMENINYKLESVDLLPGDEILIYTDGVTEATDKLNNLYGVDKLLEFMNKTKYETSQDLISKINNELDDFQKEVEQADDITLLMLRYKPNYNKGE